MKNIYYLKKDMQRAFMDKMLWFSIIILTMILMHGMVTYTIMDRSAKISTYVYIVNAMALSGFGPFAAVFPSLGYPVRFCEEYNSGYYRMIQSRTGWKQYAIVRLVSVGISGGFIVGIPFACVCIIAYAVGVHGVPEDGFLAGLQVVEYIEKYGDLFVLAFKVLLGFLFGMLFALVSFAFAVWSRNRYVTVIAPFILYETMWVVLYNYPVFNPIYLVRGDDLDSYPLSALMEMIYIILAATVCWLGLRKRARNE